MDRQGKHQTVTWIRLSNLEELAEDGRSHSVPVQRGTVLLCYPLLFCGQLCLGSALAAEK